MKAVIIGGGSAGTTCAFELRKQEKDAEITIIEKTSYLEYSPCALPYVLSGEIQSFDDIFIFKKQDYQDNNIKLMLNTEVKHIDQKNKKIILADGSETDYDRLVLATGSTCFVPPIQGIETIDFEVLKTIDDAKKIKESLPNSKDLVLIGAGMIGVELAVSLVDKGRKVTIVEAYENILPNCLDEDMSKILEEYLNSRNVDVQTSAKIKSISKNEVCLDVGNILFNRLIVCTGVRSNIGLAKVAGLNVDKGIIVDEFLQTSDKNIFACGDCVESYEYNSGKKIFSQLGTTAVRQAKVIAKNVLGKQEKFSPVMNNTISKIGDFYVGSVGMTKTRAEKSGLKAISARYTGNVRAEYYPSKEIITIKLVCDESGILVGGQIIGHAEVAGRLDLLALAIQKRLNINELAKLETCYNPASAPIFDPITITAEICQKKLAIGDKE